MLGRLGTLLLGGALGAGLAMLMAPRTGPETQAQLRQRVAGLKDQYGDVVERGRLRATELVQSSREMLDQRLSQSQEAVNTAIEKARTTLETSTEQRAKPFERSESTEPPKHS